MLHQGAGHLVQHEPHQRHQARGVRWRRLQVERNGPLAAHQVRHPEVRGRRHLRHNRISKQAEEALRLQLEMADILSKQSQ